MADSDVKFDKKEFIDFCLANGSDGILSLEQHLLSDTETISPYYINFRDFLSRNEIVDRLIEDVHNVAEDRWPKEKIDSYVGIPYGMTSLGVSISRKYGKKLIVAKKQESKNASSPEKRWFDGLIKGDKVLVLEDTLRTGDDTYHVLQHLQEAGAKIVGALALVDRREKLHPDINGRLYEKFPAEAAKLSKVNWDASTAFYKIFGVNFHSLSDIHYLLKRADEISGVSKERKKECAKFYLENGCDLNVGRNFNGDLEVFTMFPFMEEVADEIRSGYLEKLRQERGGKINEDYYQKMKVKFNIVPKL